MNKTTIKISVLAFLGFMTYGYAQQQDHEGKVGVNTTEPSATMDIRPNDENARAEAKTNEGIIAPKLSKTRIANIETPVEGTLVYATDNVYTGTNDKVAKITEKGYYYYNGTEWVKAGSETSQQLWQKQTNKDILLVDNDIQNTVKYTENGGYWSFPKQLRPSSKFDTNTSSVVTEPFNFFSSKLGNSGILNVNYADKILTLSSNSKEKLLVSNDFRIDGESNSSSINRYATLLNVLTTELNSTRNFELLYGSINNVNHYGTGRVSSLIGTYNTTHIFNGSSDRLVGSYNQVSSHVSADTNRMEGAYNVIFPSGTGKISFADAVRNNLRLDNAKGDITNASTSKNEVFIPQSFSNTIDNLMGTYTSFAGIKSNHTGTIKNMYGLKIDDVNKGTQINRAIHTEAGQIRFGDLRHSVSTSVASTGDRPVFVTADGVLKVGDASTALARAIWETDGNNVKLAVTADGSDRVDNIITINDAGQIFASSFKGTNGATIFPDYVFQKYYTGTSNIKSDYNFKSLSQVEDFVKANGHLPGYKSAETIKAQGYVDLMETQLTNVEKIEELYLHSIEQDKVNKQQAEALRAKDAEIADLKQRLERLEKLIQ